QGRQRALELFQSRVFLSMTAETTWDMDVVARVAHLARERFAPRAAHYDRTATFPLQDFEDLFAAGLNAPTIPRELGGLGFGPYRDDVFTLWMMTKEIAKADLSLARCWEGHANSLVLLDGLASEAQRRRWFTGIVERNETWVAWSGEPQARATGEQVRFGTSVELTEGGFVLNGTKAFCTSAGGARWALLLVNPAGPGGARHASAEAAETVLLLACDLMDPTIRIDGSWWDPIGMRATVSHAVHFANTFIPQENHLGEHLASETVDHCVRACGARALNRPSPIERIVRDLTIYVRHDNDDQVLATIGRQVLGKKFDSSFFKATSP